MQLRYLQTLSEIGINQNSTVVFPLPIDLIGPLLKAAETVRRSSEEGPPAELPAELPAGNGADGGALTAPRQEPAPAKRRAADRRATDR
jgi:hypothetical protein